MQNLKAGDRVQLNPEVLKDESKKSNHHILRRILQEEGSGEVIKKGETVSHPGWWVRFSYATILLEPQQVVVL